MERFPFVCGLVKSFGQWQFFSELFQGILWWINNRKVSLGVKSKKWNHTKFRDESHWTSLWSLSIYTIEAFIIKSFHRICALNNLRIFSNLEVALNEIPSTLEHLEWFSELEWYVMYDMWYELTLLHTFINFNDLGRKFHMDVVNVEKGDFEEQLAEVVRKYEHFYNAYLFLSPWEEFTNNTQTHHNTANTETRVVETRHCLPPPNNSSWSQTWPAPFCLEGPPLFGSSFFS